MPFVFIGAGGMGKETVSRIKYMTEKAGMTNVFFLGLDIDWSMSSDSTSDITLPNISVAQPWADIIAQKKDNNEKFFKWFPPTHEITSPLNGSSGSGQIRINGRFALYMNSTEVKKEITKTIDNARNLAETSANDDEICVYLISSLGGGTGSGTFLDIAFITRNILDARHRLYGVFYDGTITKGYQDNTQLFSYAALQEIEYWLQNYKRFDMTYAGGQRVTGDNLNRLFDFIFLVQAETSNGKKFNTSGKVVSPYIPMVSEAMYTLISFPEVRKYFMANNWNRFDNLNNEGMQIRYAGFGVGSINYDEEGVLDYAANRLILQHVLDWDKAGTAGEKKTGLADSAFDEIIEKALQISERVDQALTGRILHASANYAAIFSRLSKFKSSLGSKNKLKDVEQLKSQYKIPLIPEDPLHEWGDFLTKYTQDIQAKLVDIEGLFNKKLEDYLTRFISSSSLSLLPVADWLNNGVGVIDKNIEYIKKYKKTGSRMERIEAINKAWAEMAKNTKFLIGGVKAENKSKLIGAVDHWIRDEIAAVEAGPLTDFYERLKGKLQGWTNSISILQDKIAEVRQRISIQIGRYTSRDVAYNLDSLASNEFPLHIKLDINQELIDDFIIKRSILSDKGIVSAISNLQGSICSGKDTLKGILDHFQTISKEVFGNRERAIRADIKMSDDILTLIKSLMKEKIRAAVNSVKIDDILEHWLKDQIYPVAKKHHDEENHAALRELKKRWAINFGKDQAVLLIAPDYFSGEKDKLEEWFDVAIRSFIFNFQNKITPFIRYGKTIKHNYWNKIPLDTNQKNAFGDRVTVFLPHNFRFAKAVSKDGSGSNIVYTRESHNCINIFAETYAFPLHALDLVTGSQEPGTKDEYLKHRKEFAAQLGRGAKTAIPLHIDNRFYTDWLIDIADTEIADVSGYWLYILSLGLGYIERVAKGKFTLKLDGKSKTISATLPGTLAKIKETDLKQSLRPAVGDGVKTLYFENGRDYKAVLELFKKAFASHIKTKPPTTTATESALRLWNEINDYIKVLADGSFASSARVPKTWDDCEKLINEL